MWRLYRIVWGLAFLAVVLLPCDRLLAANGGDNLPQQARVLETEINPQSRPLTFSQLLDEYLAMLQGRLKHDTEAVQESGLVEVKLTIRRDGSVTFGEVVVLDGPADLREELLPVVHQLNPLPPPPVDTDLLDVSVLLTLQYPNADLLDTIQERGR
jgi:hypothetical protein